MDKISELSQKLHATDQKIMDSLKPFFETEQITLIMSQLNTIYSIITKTEMRYQYSKDYRDAIDIIMGLIIGGRFINAKPKNTSPQNDFFQNDSPQKDSPNNNFSEDNFINNINEDKK